MVTANPTARRLFSLGVVLTLGTLAGCETSPATPPEAAVDLEPAFSKVGGLNSVDILTFGDEEKIGDASLTRTRNGVTLRAHMEADHGETFTVWTAVFNNPDACATSPCAGSDLGNPDVGGNVIRIAGGIAGGDGLHVAGNLREGDTSEALFEGAPPLLDAMTAELHFIYRSHGPKLPTKIDEQIMEVFGGCDMNDCNDLAFSIHLP